MPTGDKMIEVMNTYKLLGFNGCVGSMDCTHIYCWNKCPKELLNFCVGKEGKPTVSFQCVVDHEKKVQMCSPAFCGVTNDKLIFKTVAETLQIINGKLEDVTFTLYDANGQLVYCKGVYLIVDCGY